MPGHAFARKKVFDKPVFCAYNNCKGGWPFNEENVGKPITGHAMQKLGGDETDIYHDFCWSVHRCDQMPSGNAPVGMVVDVRYKENASV